MVAGCKPKGLCQFGVKNTRGGGGGGGVAKRCRGVAKMCTKGGENVYFGGEKKLYVTIIVCLQS
jgi:hypothetical protein